ncbi:hypothetical protein H310_10897 [Aphanomyces invadans]|uniref:Bromo domain-containing protein n=1 Tax=Aphanomyces invadans TaxID=157072 RepID=A0A024TNZ6_9STRA|nr:hypothetical protein H310_10897 [Aphanomyces invadans]ETV95855.1 hypothetical protein H310_10897 [Aphanomyces invadans]|eukprot:XP_008875606.1 hypothetical protein H310_10897 [Aphanomyces invadans]
MADATIAADDRVLVDLGFDKDASNVYLARGREWIGSSAVSRKDMMSHFRLDASLKAMSAAELPTGCKHLLKGLGLSNSHADLTNEYGTNLSLLTVLDERAFGRPIEPLPDQMVQAGFQFPTTAPLSSATTFHKTSKSARPGFVQPPPAKTTASVPVDAKAAATAAMTAQEKLKKEEKKREKKRKREKEEAESLKTILDPLVHDLKALTWKAWPDAKGKPSNPFIVKITKENCKALGVPNYFDYVQEPMDLTRIGEKVQKQAYLKLEQVEADIALLVANAKRFNREGDPVHEMAIEFQRAFDDKLRDVYRPIMDDLAASRKKLKKEKKKKKDKKAKDK